MKTTIKAFTAVSAILASSFAMASSEESVDVDKFLETASKHCEGVSEDVRYIVDSRIDDVPIYEVLNLIKSVDVYDSEIKNLFIGFTKEIYSFDSVDVLMYGSGRFATDFYMNCMEPFESMVEDNHK